MRLIDTAAAAVMLRCSERRIRRLVERGALTNHGTPRAIRVDLDELARLVATGKVQPATRERV